MVVDPFAGCGGPLASRNGRGMSDDRYQLAVTSCLDPKNAKTVVVIMEGNAFNETGENFLAWWFLLRLAVGRCTIGFGAEHANPTAYKSERTGCCRPMARNGPAGISSIGSLPDDERTSR